jgi:PAS domain S-box-containing protein
MTAPPRPGRGIPGLARLRGMRWKVAITAAVALTLSGAALTVALAAADGVRAAGAELSQRLVPAASVAVSLLSLQADQQNSLRNYVTAGPSGTLAPYRADAEGIRRTQATLAGLIRGYGTITPQLAATATAYRGWLTGIAAPELAAAGRGDFAAARAIQNDIPRVRPPVLALRARGYALQSRIAGTQQAVTARLVRAQGTLFHALVAMCAVVAILAIGNVAAVWRRLIRPFSELRRAADRIAAGEYDIRIPAVGPAELADLGRSAELMRTRLVAALAERERAEERFRHLFDAAPDAMVAIAADGTVVMANRQAAELYGYLVDDLVGRPGQMLVSQASHRVMAGRCEQDPVGYEGTLQVTGLRRDGSEFPAEVNLSALPADGGMLRVAAIRDISERLAMEAERERLRREAEEERAARRQRQSERLESLGQLVGGVAHDFNNLLNVIQGYTDFTAEQVSALAETDHRLRPALEDIEQVRSATQKATRLTRQLLTFAKHDVIRPEVLDLSEAVSGLGELLHRTLGEHIELIITTDQGLWPVLADRGQLEQVLVNLAVNARDAMPRGGRLTVDTRNVAVDTAIAATRPGLEAGRYVRMRVADTGTGMDRATLERVFEPFFTTKPKGHGTGLGLATVYGIVTQAGGTIDVYSEPGLGTTISALLPATKQDATPEAAPDGPGTDMSGHGETILLVEDEESLREMTRRILAGNGYRVRVAASAEDAVRLAAEPGRHFDLLLSDMVMPGMLGQEVAARVQAEHPATPVLFMSGYAEPILDARGMTAGHLDLLEKPFTEAALLSRVRQAIRGARVPRPRVSPIDQARHPR